MTMVGGFDVHRQQITFDYVDDDGWCTGVRSVRRHGRRAGLAWRALPGGDAEFALEG